MKRILLSPSILSADFASLADAAKQMEKAGADWLHIDVMDGHFVPNLTIGPVVVKSLKKHTALPMDVHLMITDPLAYAEPFAKAGAWGLTFHVEAVNNPAAVIAEIKKLGLKPGISLKPKTPASAVLPFLKDLNVVLVMTVEPGFGGQSFMADMIPKIKEIAAYIRENKLSCKIEVDGGIDSATAPETVRAGADVLVAGQAIFGKPDPVLAAVDLRPICRGSAVRAGFVLRKKGFTLIELMIVVAILGILAGVATGKFSDLVSKSKESRVKNSLAALRSGLSIYYSDNQFYPGDPGTSLTAGTKYLAAIPPAEIPPVPSQGNPGHASGNSISILLDDQSTGQWAYLFAGTTDSQFVVNCTHMDTRGLSWSAY